MSRWSLDSIEYTKNNAKLSNNNHNKRKHKHRHKHRHRHKYKNKIFGSLLDTCSVCLNNDNILDTRLFPCKHAFHGDCLIEWVKQSGKFTCPLCRQNINYFGQIGTKQNDELLKIWNEHHLISKNENKISTVVVKKKPNIIEINIDNESSQGNGLNIIKGKGIYGGIIVNYEAKYTSMIYEISTFIGDINWYTKSKEISLHKYNGYIKDREMMKYKDEYECISKDDIIIDSKYNVNIINFEAGLCGGLFGTFVKHTILRNKIPFDSIPRTGMYFLSYEYIKNALNVSDNDSSIIRMNKRFISAYASSSLCFGINNPVAFRFGVFFSTFEMAKDSYIYNYGTLNMKDVFISANIGAVTASLIYYPISINGNIFKCNYNGFFKCLKGFLPSCVMCSCVFESTKRYLMEK